MYAWIKRNSVVIGVAIGAAGLLSGLVFGLFQIGVLKLNTLPSETEVRPVRLFTAQGLAPDYRVKKQVSGSCDAGAITSSDPEAFRCLTDDNEVLDPCWANGQRTLVACPDTPWSLDVALLDPVTLPKRGAAAFPEPGALPWGIEIVSSGQHLRCILLSSFAGEAEHNGRSYRRNYTCSGADFRVEAGFAYGDTDRTRSPWRILFGAPDGGTLTEVVIIVAWL